MGVQPNLSYSLIITTCISEFNMVGAPFSWDNKFSSLEQSEAVKTGGEDRYIDYSYAKYIGGHPLHTKARDTGVYIYNDRMEIVNPYLVIPYSAIERIENMDEKKIDREKVILGLLFFTPLAIHAAIKRKNHIYTIIQYSEPESQKQFSGNLGSTHLENIIQYRKGGDKITIILDLNVDINRIQSLIYNKMIETKLK